jgi:integrative and conjugative element protein (TIGR02256 family)
VPRRLSGDVAWVAAEALALIEAEARRRAPNETGGVLLGYWSAEGDEVVITCATGAGPRAKHSKVVYTPDRDYDQALIADYYLAAGRRITYLGDWHTHPDAGAYLSDQDRRTLRQIAESPSARAPNALMAVLAGGRPWELHVWVGRVQKRRWWTTSLETKLLTVRAFGPQEIRLSSD